MLILSMICKSKNYDQIDKVYKQNHIAWEWWNLWLLSKKFMPLNFSKVLKWCCQYPSLSSQNFSFSVVLKLLSKLILSIIIICTCLTSEASNSFWLLSLTDSWSFSRKWLVSLQDLTPRLLWDLWLENLLRRFPTD